MTERRGLNWIHVVGAIAFTSVVGWCVLRRRAQLRVDRGPAIAASAVEVAPPPRDPIVYLALTESKDAVPTRFSAPPPIGTKADFATSYPGGQVVDALCTDDDSMRARFLATLAATADADLADEWLRWNRPHCRAPSFCAWGADAAEKATAHARQISFAMIADCEGERVDALFAGPDVPEDAARWRKQFLHPSNAKEDAPLDEQVLWPSNPDQVIAKFGVAAVGEALARCAIDSNVVGAPEGCLAWLARIDRDRAVSVATAMDTAEPAAFWARPLVRALRDFPAEGALETHLAALHLIDPSLPAKVPMPIDLGRYRAPDRASAEGLLHIAGRALAWDEEDGESNSYAALARALATIVRPALDGAYFLEDDAGDGHGTLHAWFDGNRFDAPPAAGDWFDVTRAVGFMNACLRARGASVRLLALSDPYQSGIAIAGPEAGLRALVAEGLVVVAGVPTPLDPMRKKMIDSLTDGGDPSAP